MVAGRRPGAGFQWIDANDATNNVFSFLRRDADGSPLACVANFAAVPHHDYRLGLPAAGTWAEVLNTDADVYAGSGVGNLGAVSARRPPEAVARPAPPPRHDLRCRRWPRSGPE